MLRRRVAAVLGEWAGDDASPAARSKSYAILVQLLADDPASDISVRLAAAQALDASIGNSWHFDEQAFVPHLDEAMQRLLTLLFDCALPDSQLRVTCAIGVLIERLSSHVHAARTAGRAILLKTSAQIAPFAQRLLQALPVIWSNAGETHLLRVAVLTTMAKLVDVGKSVPFQPSSQLNALTGSRRAVSSASRSNCSFARLLDRSTSGPLPDRA